MCLSCNVVSVYFFYLLFYYFICLFYTMRVDCLLLYIDLFGFDFIYFLIIVFFYSLQLFYDCLVNSTLTLTFLFMYFFIKTKSYARSGFIFIQIIYHKKTLQGNYYPNNNPPIFQTNFPKGSLIIKETRLRL